MSKKPTIDVTVNWNSRVFGSIREVGLPKIGRTSCPCWRLSNSPKRDRMQPRRYLVVLMMLDTLAPSAMSSTSSPTVAGTAAFLVGRDSPSARAHGFVSAALSQTHSWELSDRKVSAPRTNAVWSVARREIRASASVARPCSS